MGDQDRTCQDYITNCRCTHKSPWRSTILVLDRQDGCFIFLGGIEIYNSYLIFTYVFMLCRQLIHVYITREELVTPY